MGQHDEYGKHLLRRIAGDAFAQYGSCISVDYGTGHGGHIDGVLSGEIGVEIESRVSKQIRGAVLDLICHPCPKKLLIILPVHAANPLLTAAQCRNIMARFLPAESFRVVVLAGSGRADRLSEDSTTVRAALKELGFDPSAMASA